MTEDEARDWLIQKGVSRETYARLETYVELLLEEADRQNLISASTRDSVWARHIVDSAQLLDWVPEMESAKLWIDIGSGAGLPGLVVALLSDWNVALVESRRKRVDFLHKVSCHLQLDNVSIMGSRVEVLSFSESASIISARAYAPLSKIFETTSHVAGSETFWLLPKGKSWQSDLDAASREWKGSFHVEQSVTDSESAIIVAQGVKRRSKR
ncbi:16S rRNA (guanine(527)-N(7))-methyltransferase RsmG [Sphingobium sp. SCG-1]|uniref:16S rRNA (guanine(527)-N(7))-methyltransferase RsmG n=1 Tax=Sphingobium sp. SCG-1 TaxID=2072936 RepID=UPI000CD67CC3|nr:16S rRNA (guanine(527)-N(7))-methyltransferase RsmG [Sphingobium sp. SCG-1]AUW56907.1 16S rRNA (guanine(527)-N(7))-methyltransferase RsmG [Sphingobium sp. SCG-1]